MGEPVSASPWANLGRTLGEWANTSEGDVMGCPIERSKYEAARERIESGLWQVDADAGIVTGCWDRPIGSVDEHGYVRLTLILGGRTKTVRKARVVFEYANAAIPPGYEVTHANGRRSDDRLCNLVATLPKGNIARSLRRGNTA